MIITSVGDVRNYRDTDYRLGERTVRTNLFSLALVQLLEREAGETVMVVTTPEMGESFRFLQERFAEEGFTSVQKLPVPPAECDDSFFESVLALIEAIPRKEGVVLDLTHGFRSLPFVYFVTLLFLHAFREVSLEGVYYGAYQKEVAETPVVDLTSLFVMARWSQAVETFRISGDLTFLRELVSQESSRWYRSAGGQSLGKKLSSLKTPLLDLEKALSHCLPLEAGLAISRLLNALHFSPEAGGYEQFLSRIFQEASDELSSFQVQVSDKQLISLNREELVRQLKMARWYQRHGAPDHALIVLSEWITSRVLMAGGGREWLDYKKERARARARINACHWKIVDTLPSMDPVGKQVGDLGQQIGDLRNQFAHAGMKPFSVESKGLEEKLEKYLNQCEAVLDADLALFAPSPEARRLLVVPFGLSPGILYSAVTSDQTDWQGYLIILSVQSKARLSETLAALARSGKPLPTDRVYQLLLTDPHCQFLRQDDLVPLSLENLTGQNESLVQYLTRFDQVSGCVTGGTTAMQYLVERILDLARRMGVWETTRFALIDRRPAEEQRMNPFIVGERVELDRRRESER